jgi:hypothetical protein
MQRFIQIVDGVVAREFFGLAECPGNVLTDPSGVFPVGAEFSQSRYEAAYGAAIQNGFTSDTSIFLLPPAINNKHIFAAAGLTPNIQPTAKSKYVYVATDSVDMFAAVGAYSKHHNVRTPNYALVDKTLAQPLFGAAGFSLLATAVINNRANLEAFPYERIILKPAISANGQALGHPLAPALYIIKTKAELLTILDELVAFSDPTLLANNPTIVQQVADGDGENFEALILSGVVNGAGDIWHLAPIELSQQYNDTGRYAKTVWSPENSTAETMYLQQCVERLLANAGSVNCFYQLQFLRSGGAWVPHDFQYRMTYYVDTGLEQLGFAQHKTDIIRFAFDQSKQQTAQSRSFGLKLRAQRARLDTKQFVSGANKTEVLAKLEPL